MSPAIRYHFLTSVTHDPVPLHTGRIYVLGRSRDSDIPINDVQVSRRHAELRHDLASFTLVDLDSRNGTYVNGRRIREKTLRNGDKFRIGMQTYNYIISTDPSGELLGRKPSADTTETMDATDLLHQQDDGAIMGSLAQFSLPELIQFLHTGARSGFLEIRGGHDRVGRFWLDHGSLIDGELDDLRGDEALLSMARHQAGFFSFQPSDGAPPRTRTVEVSTQNLLLEVCRILDEEGTRQAGAMGH